MQFNDLEFDFDPMRKSHVDRTNEVAAAMKKLARRSSATFDDHFTTLDACVRVLCGRDDAPEYVFADDGDNLQRRYESFGYLMATMFDEKHKAEASLAASIRSAAELIKQETA
jgi:hypothetical protein